MSGINKQLCCELFSNQDICCFALDQKKLSVGSYLHCAISLEEQSDMDVNESQVVTISVDPETISVSVVSFHLHLTC